MPEKTYTLHELAEASGETPRTIRYYVSKGLLPAPGRGAAACYRQEHLDRIGVIKQQQARGISLEAIRIGFQLPGPFQLPQPPWEQPRPPFSLQAGDWNCQEIAPGVLVLIQGGTATLWSRKPVKEAAVALVQAIKEGV